MSTYTKAWAMAGLFVGSFALSLVGWLIMAWKGAAFAPMWWMGIPAFVIIGFLSMKFPRCPNCGTAVNIPEATGDGGGFFIYPERPSKECGFCGHDLTARRL